MTSSPYEGLPPSEWERVTRELVKRHPFSTREIVEVVLGCWESLFASSIGTRGFRIGVNIFPKPQIMGFLLHELIPLELQSRYPKTWRIDTSGGEKDIVHLRNLGLSVELKTSSNPRHIFGNRSYAQEGSSRKKSKSGYYLAVNFEKFSAATQRPCVLRIRFGWLDSSDWIGQRAATGQQCRLPPEVEERKLLTIYPPDP